MTPQTLKKVGPSTLIESPGDTEKGVPMLSNGTTKINEILEAAREYIFKGISVIPLKAKGKTPAITSWKEFQNRLPTDAELVEWFADGKNNIGIVTGKLSGLTVVDFDTPEAIELAKEKGFPKGPLVKTARGFHAYCKYEEGHRNFQKKAGLPGIDLRGEGGYVVAPPSIHATGKAYEWVTE